MANSTKTQQQNGKERPDYLQGVFEDEIIYSDCSGWLIPNDKVEEFRAEYEGFKDFSKWEDYVAWETWEKSNGKISVKIELL